MRYAQLVDMKIDKLYNRKPDWWNGDPSEPDSRPLTDEELIALFVYPVVENWPTYDRLFYSCALDYYNLWVIREDYVEATYTVEEVELEQAKLNCLKDLDRQESINISTGISFHGGIFSPNPANLSDIASLKDAVAIGMSVMGPYPYEFNDRYWVDLNDSDIDLLIANSHEFLNQLWGNKKNKQTEIQSATSLEDLKAIDLNITIGG